jgi:two-component system, OmpR family, copper resistance phosphate regulon response regulator CusR
MRILLVEDDKKIADFVKRGLKSERFVVDSTARSEQALLWAKVNDYDLAVMDIKLVGRQSGIEICKAVREKGKTFPIIILSALHETATKIQALNSGADDYLTKPFSMVELVARIRALLRREKVVIGPVLKVADLTMDVNAHVVRRDTTNIILNRKEFSLLEYLMRNPGTTLTRTMILDHVWETTTDPFS